jgi:hypothetical protein
VARPAGLTGLTGLSIGLTGPVTELPTEPPVEPTDGVRGPGGTSIGCRRNAVRPHPDTCSRWHRRSYGDPDDDPYGGPRAAPRPVRMWLVSRPRTPYI